MSIERAEIRSQFVETSKNVIKQQIISGEPVKNRLKTNEGVLNSVSVFHETPARTRLRHVSEPAKVGTGQYNNESTNVIKEVEASSESIFNSKK